MKPGLGSYLLLALSPLLVAIMHAGFCLTYLFLFTFLDEHRWVGALAIGIWLVSAAVALISAPVLLATRLMRRRASGRWILASGAIYLSAWGGALGVRQLLALAIPSMYLFP